MKREPRNYTKALLWLCLGWLAIVLTLQVWADIVGYTFPGRFDWAFIFPGLVAAALWATYIVERFKL